MNFNLKCNIVFLLLTLLSQGEKFALWSVWFTDYGIINSEDG